MERERPGHRALLRNKKALGPGWLCVAVIVVASAASRLLVAQTAPKGTASEQIDALFGAVSGKDYPGAAVVVLRAGQVIHSRAYGLANVELGVPNTLRTKFRLASVTKSFTSLAVLQLVEQGRLHLDDPLAKYVPDFAGGDRITIHHLLSHTAGLPDFIPFDQARKLPRDSEPGERLNYSNIGYIALGKVVAKVTGKTFEEQLGEAILSPLGMGDTGVDRRQPIEKGRACGYIVGPQGALVNADYTESGDDPEAGGLYSTADDMTIWMKALLTGRIVSAEMFRTATTPVRLNDGRLGAYGYGFMLVPFRGLKELGHGGDISGFNSYVGVYPDEHLAVIVLSNLGMRSAGVIPTAGDIVHRIVGILAADRLGPEWPPAVQVPPDVLDRYVGRYRVDAPPMITGVMGDTIEFSRDGTRLLATGKQGRAEIFAESDTTFYAKGAPVKFTFVGGPGGRAGNAVLTLAAVREYRLLRMQ